MGIFQDVHYKGIENIIFNNLERNCANRWITGREPACNHQIAFTGHEEQISKALTCIYEIKHTYSATKESKNLLLNLCRSGTLQWSRTYIGDRRISEICELKDLRRHTKIISMLQSSLPHTWCCTFELLSRTHLSSSIQSDWEHIATSRGQGTSLCSIKIHHCHSNTIAATNW